MQAAVRDEGRQYALPLVVLVERADPPARTDALEGAARAVLEFLSDPRVTEPDGEWAAAARAWEDARIRKVVRRARGAAWERARALPGITVGQGTAEVRVYPPVPVDDWPPDLAKLQVSGTDFEDPDPAGRRTGRGAGAVAESGAADVDRESHGPGRPRCATRVVGAGTDGPFEMERC